MDLSKTIIILETNPPSPIFDNKPAYALWFKTILKKFDKKVKIIIYNVVAGKYPEKLDGVVGIIITGSVNEVYENTNWMEKTKNFVKKIIEKKIPLLGVCFGYQLVAQMFGGKVERNPKGREIGTCLISLENEAIKDDLFLNIPKKFKVQESHVSAVTVLPKKAIRLAGNNYGTQAFRIKNQKIWGVQFHPEVTPDDLKKVIKFRQNILLSEGLDARKIYAEVTLTKDAQKILQNFLNITYANS